MTVLYPRILLILLELYAVTAQAKSDNPLNLSLSSGAFAANAGGQEAYALRAHQGTGEGHVYINRSLTVGNLPLGGAGYDFRFNACDECFWKFFVQTGGGLSNAGIYAELLWGMTVPLLPIWLPMNPPRYVPHLRLDFATHLIFGQLRPITWSYPLWLGIGIPL